MGYIAIFFAGGLLCNSLPHLASGLCGTPFPTPFAKPHGVGNSSPLVNFLWGAANFFVGLYLLQRHPVSVGLSVDFVVLLVGVVAVGTFSSVHFARVCGLARPE
jgi:hypothetical protein